MTMSVVRGGWEGIGRHRTVNGQRSRSLSRLPEDKSQSAQLFMLGNGEAVGPV